MTLIDELIERMARGLTALAPDDARRFFHGTYLRTTEAVAAEIRRGGFGDGEWVEQWDVAFASLYLDAFDRFSAGEATSGPWRVAFAATRGDRLPPLRHVLLGINAHVNFDLPQALLVMIDDASFDDSALMARRAADHEHIDHVLASRLVAEDELLREVEQPGDRGLLDRIQVLSRLGTNRFLREARRKVWRNAVELSQARRRGADELQQRLAELEHLAMRRVADLVRPRNVIFELARRGFGVALPTRTTRPEPR
jgi:hypothetical protein